MEYCDEIIAYLQDLGLETKRVSGTHGGEYHGPCPFCGGKDRFVIQPNRPEYPQGFYWCRQCGRRSLEDVVRVLEGDHEEALAIACENRRSVCETSSFDWNVQRTPPGEEWQRKMIEILDCYQAAPLRSKVYLPRGISEETVRECRLSYLHVKQSVSVDGEKIFVPSGLLIPNYRGEELYALRVRLFSGSPKYRYVKGSMAIPYHLTRLDRLDAPVVIVESELDAVLLYQEAGDLVHAVALGSATNKPDSYIRGLLRVATSIFVCLDYDDPGIEAWGWWEHNYPDAHRVFAPKGKDVGDFILGGGSVREWVEDMIAKSEAGGEIVSRAEPEFEAILVQDTESAKEIVEELKTECSELAVIVKAGITDGQSMDPGLEEPKVLALSSGPVSYVFNLLEVHVEAFAGLGDCRLVTFDGAKQLALLHLMGIDVETIDCVALQSNVINNKRWSLEDISQFRLGYGTAELEEARFDLEEYGEPEFFASAAEAHATMKLHEKQKVILARNGRGRLYSLMAGAMPAIAGMMCRGFPVDWSAHENLIEKWSAMLDKVGSDEKEHGPIESRLKVWGEALTRFKSPRTGRLHPDFVFNGTVTGRFASSKPNLHGMPKDPEIRSLCRPPEGYVLVGADYSQVDLRVAAEIADDDTMRKAFAENQDFHRATAAIMYGVPACEVSDSQRQEAKSNTYAPIYNGGEGLRPELRSAFPGLVQWMAKQRNKRFEMQIFTPARRRIIRDFSERKWMNLCLNYPIQGGSAEVMLAALGLLPKYLSGIDAVMINCVHDEIVLEVAEKDAKAAKDALERAMTDGFRVIFPEAPTRGLVDAKVGRTWADLK